MPRDRQLSELSLIDWIRSTTKPGNHPLEIGDDCAVLNAPGGQYVITTDMLLEGVHFESGCTPYRIGWKAAARSLSDIAAMACRASAITLAVVFTKGTDEAFCKSIFKGVRAVCSKFDVPLVGGDVSSWDGKLVLNVTALGDVSERPPILRSGAKVGDCLFVSGALGGSIIKRHLHFEPRLELAEKLAARFEIRSMIDISDGLARDLSHITDESGVGATVLASNIPVSRDAALLSKTSGRTPLEHALFDGEDYELLFTAPPSQRDEILAAELPARVSYIGLITDADMKLQTKDSLLDLEPRGFEHSIQ